MSDPQECPGVPHRGHTNSFKPCPLEAAEGYPPVQVPENTGKHPEESSENGANKVAERIAALFDVVDELFDHRRALGSVLAIIATGSDDSGGSSWRSKQHHPDDSVPMPDGHFIVGIELPNGTITYHHELEHWNDFDGVHELEHAPAWDGHTSHDVVTRLEGFRGFLRDAIRGEAS